MSLIKGYIPLYTPQAPLPNQLDTLECKALEETEMFVQTLIESLSAHKHKMHTK